MPPGFIGEKLRFLRLQRGISQTDLSHDLGSITQSYLSYLEAGQKTPSLELVLRIAAYFGVSIEYLLRDTLPIESPSAGSYDFSPDQPPSMRLFGAKLRFVRTQHRLSQMDLARRLNLTANVYISALENGRKAPTIDLMLVLADLFQVPMVYFVSDTIPVEIESDDENNPSSSLP